jgi:hypothetical protein
MVDDDPESQRAFELLDEAQREHDRGGPQEAKTAKVYQLDPTKALTPKPHTKGDDQ